MKTLKFRLTFTETVLGGSPNNVDIYSEYIGSKGPDAVTLAEEVEAIGATAVEEKGTTVFARDPDGNPMLWDYQIKGFFKDACAMLGRVKDTGKSKGTESSKLKAYKKIIDGLIFVYPRKITIQNYGDIGNCQRPLRASTAQGERIALASSEEIQAGAFIEIEVELYDDSLEKQLIEWFDYGAARGIGQWRNASHGRFVWEQLDPKTGAVIDGNKPEATA